jgi:UMF1 family MFS transporter
LLTFLLFFSRPGDVYFVLILFCLAQYFFVGGNVFYDAFLPQLTKGRDMDRLSGQGYALGYLGGGLLLAISVLFIQFSHMFGIQKDAAVRLSLASAGLWWALFGSISFLMFREKKDPLVEQKSIGRAALEGLQKTWETTREIAGYRQTLIFLVAYMIYNDGVQTVIRMASIYGMEELHLSMGTLLGTLLMVQFIGIGGAILMSWIARRCGTKQTIMGLLAVWFGLTIFAYRMNSSLEFWILGIAVGMILGGTQALSRSFYGRLIPEGQSAQFFGYFSVFSKLSAIWGPILFAFIRQATGTSRYSVLAVSIFFLVGGLILYLLKEENFQ